MLKIQIKEINNKGFAIATVDGNQVGEMTYSTPGTGFIIVDYTRR